MYNILLSRSISLISSPYRIYVNTEIEQRRRLPQKWVKEVIQIALSAEHIALKSTVEVLLGGDTTIKQLNSKFRFQNSVTDILSFPTDVQDDQFPNVMSSNDIGQIVLSIPQIERQSVEAGVGLKQEGTHVLVHGVLHLLGYDHETAEEEKLMHLRENDIVYSITGVKPHEVLR